MRLLPCCFLAALTLACVEGADPPSSARPVPGAPGLRVAPDPGPPPLEQPPRATLWQREGDGWRALGRVTAVAPGGRAVVDAARRLWIDGRLVAEHALPEVSVGPDAVAFTRAPQPPDRDVWRVDADGKPRAVTSDGQSDRPFFLPDGRLLWVSSAGTGRAGFVLEGRRLTADGPVPAFPDRTRFVDGQIEFDAGEGVFRLDLKNGAMVPR